MFQKALKTCLLLWLGSSLSACTSVDAVLQVFAEVQNATTVSSASCSTTCVTNIFNDPAKPDPVLQASATSPRSCDPAFFLTAQNWMISEFNLADPSICATLADSNPTEVLCEVQDGSTLVHTYLGLGDFPFVAQGCERTNLVFTVIIEDLLVVNDLGELGNFSCETLNTAYADNGCVPGDDTLPVCAALNGLDSPCLP